MCKCYRPNTLKSIIFLVSATKETKPMNVEFEKSGTVCNDCKPPSVMNRFRSFLKRRILDRTMNEQQKNESIDEKLARTRKVRSSELIEIE